MMDGRIAMSGDQSLAEHLEEKGYAWTRDEKYETNEKQHPAP